MSTSLDFIGTDSWYASEDKSVIFRINTPTGGAQDITGWVIKLSLSATNGGSDVSGFPITGALTSPTTGICTVSVPTTATTGLNGTYFYSLWRTDAGFRTQLAGGLINILASQTVAP